MEVNWALCTKIWKRQFSAGSWKCNEAFTVNPMDESETKLCKKPANGFHECFSRSRGSKLITSSHGSNCFHIAEFFYEELSEY